MSQEAKASLSAGKTQIGDKGEPGDDSPKTAGEKDPTQPVKSQETSYMGQHPLVHTWLHRALWLVPILPIGTPIASPLVRTGMPLRKA